MRIARYYDIVSDSLGLTGPPPPIPQGKVEGCQYVVLLAPPQRLLAWWDLGQEVRDDDGCTFQVAGPLDSMFEAVFTAEQRSFEVPGGAVSLVSIYKLHTIWKNRAQEVPNGITRSQAAISG